MQKFKKGAAICCEVPVSLGDGENLGSGDRPTLECAFGFDLLKVEVGRRRKDKLCILCVLMYVLHYALMQSWELDAAIS